MKEMGIIPDPDDALDLDRYSRMAREQIGDHQFETVRAEGTRLSVDEALALGQTTQ